MAVEDRCLVSALVEPRAHRAHLIAKIGPIHRDFNRMHIPETPSRGSRNTSIWVIAQTKHQFQHRYKRLNPRQSGIYCDQSVPSFARRSCGLGQGANAEGSSAPHDRVLELGTAVDSADLESALLPISCSRSSVCPIRSSRASSDLGSVVRRKNGAIARQTSPQLLLFIHTRSNGRSGRLIFRLETTRRMHV
jgi:hypothetical protein